MTRTARAAYPRALSKDRSESRTGLDNSLRKQGAGHHNWGSLADERDLEYAAMEDDLREEDEVVASEPVTDDTGSSRSLSPAHQVKSEIPQGTSPEDLEKARQFRKNAFKKSGKVDLTAIARTSAAVTSPTQDLAKPATSDDVNPLF